MAENKKQTKIKMSKKNIQAIQIETVIAEILDRYASKRLVKLAIGESKYDFEPEKKSFIHDAPETWGKEETLLFDIVSEVEQKLKERILEIITGLPKNG